MEPELLVEDVLLTDDDHEILEELPEASISGEELCEGVSSNDIVVEKTTRKGAKIGKSGPFDRFFLAEISLLMSIPLFSAKKDLFRSSLEGIRTIFNRRSLSAIFSKREFALICDFYWRRSHIYIII